MTPFAGNAFRLLMVGQDPLASVTSPQGRFHRDGQVAVYTSLTLEGCIAAIQRYLRPDDAPRHIVPLRVALNRVADLRGVKGASIVWQDDVADGRSAPTWEISDRARANGAEGMLYASRSRPELTHLVLFRAGPDVIQLAGTPVAFRQS